MTPARIAAITNTTSVPTGIVNAAYLMATPIIRAEHHAERDAERRPEQRRDHTLVTDHAPDLAPGHPDGPEHAELTRSLKDGQDERVDDPEQADDDRQRKEHIEEVQERREPLELIVGELGLGLDLRVREGAERLCGAGAWLPD